MQAPMRKSKWGNFKCVSNGETGKRNIDKATHTHCNGCVRICMNVCVCGTESPRLEWQQQREWLGNLPKGVELGEQQMEWTRLTGKLYRPANWKLERSRHKHTHTRTSLNSIRGKSRNGIFVALFFVSPLSHFRWSQFQQKNPCLETTLPLASSTC